jgi:peptidoglycan L-alanyl-D-glutamate endopeptidase CwlK
MQKALALGVMDFTVICGHRNKADQDKAYAAGHSKLKFPRSKHNSWPSLAVDVVPYPLDWKDIDAFKRLGVVIKQAWASMSEAERGGYTLSWGGDWTSFRDYPHWELRK